MHVNYFFIITALITVFIILRTVRRGGLSINESFFWFLGSLVILLLSIYPELINKIALRVGVDYPPSLFFVGCVIFLLLVNLRLNKRVSTMQDKLIRLGQELAILKSSKKKRK